MKDKKYFENLLASNKIDQLVYELLDLLQQNDQEDLRRSMLLISSRYNRIKEKERKGIVSESDYNLELNKLVTAISEYLKDFRNH